MIIDFHTHFFPAAIAPKAIAGLEKSSNTKAFLNGTAEDLKKSMNNSGIDISVVLPIAVKPSQTPTINKTAIENNKIPGICSFGSVHPYYENWREEIDKLKAEGIKGIKLHPDFQEVFLDDPKMADVMEYAVEKGMLITIHGGMDVSYPHLHRSTPKRLLNILPRIKGGKIICAHSGGFRYLDDVEKYLLDKDEVYIDTSYSIGLMDNRQLKRIYMNINPTHVLFGTDSPWSDQKKSVEDLKSLNLPKKLEEKILYENALNLLK